MKKLILSWIVLLGITLNVSVAQTPEPKSTALFSKITATWCNPCGTWGWERTDQVLSNTYIKDQYLFLALYVGNPSYGNDKFLNQTAASIASSFTYSGTPSFNVNGANKTQNLMDLVQAINNFAGTAPVASAAARQTITGNVVTVNANVKFWKPTSGEYLLAAYLVEDGALNLQNGQGSDPVPHKAVLRASMSSFAFGEQIATGTIKADQEYNKSFTYTISDSEWDKSKMKVYTIIWKKNGAKFEYVNGSSTKVEGGSTVVAPISNMEQLRVFPNPVTGILNVDVTLQRTVPLQLQVIDAFGRIVYASGPLKGNQGGNSLRIPVHQYASGVYNLIIYSGTERRTSRFSVAR